MKYIFEDDGEKLFHYGTPRHSGRYPWGSGDNPYQHSGDAFISTVTDMRKSGKYKNDTEIADALGMNSSELRTRLSVARNEQRAARSAQAFKLKEKGMSTQAIADQMGIPESTVRSLLDPHVKVRTSITQDTADQLKKYVEKKKYVDVGAGSELDMGVSKERLKSALTILKDEGYVVSYVKVPQMGTVHETSLKVLSKPGTTWSDVNENKYNIKPINETIVKDGKTTLGIEPPVSVDSKRIKIRYAEDGGDQKDGVIELRRGVDDLSLGKAQYAQVRIAVDDSHYLKGMAMYSDNMPKGVDIIFNTNKHNNIPMLSDDSDNSVLKKMKKDKDNPFGATIKTEEELQVAQRYYTDKNGEKKLSPINVVNEPGDWSNWSKNLASQFLSKQLPSVAKQQLNLAYKTKEEELNDIKNLTNPVVKKKLLESYADDCDSSAVKLKAAALPRQSTSVILPFPDMKDDQIYAPNYRNGEQVALVRYPHGGRFEIPVLTVNNRQKSPKEVIENAPDAVGINAKVAQQLSGADFDGDTVIVIPLKGVNIKTEKPLKELQSFDPKEAYPAYEGMPKMKPQTKQNEMGRVSNLITDMTLGGATNDEIVRAVKHSMVVIDAEKHNLNYKLSAQENGIDELKKKYQVKPDGRTGGASTIISRAKGEVYVPTRKIFNPNIDIDPKTGEKKYRETGDYYTDKKTGEKVYRTQKSTQMAEATDARSLVSAGRYPMELIYADHANKMKALGNEARKEYLSTPSLKRSPSAAKEYAKEVKSLDDKLTEALMNAPRERQAQLLANKRYDAKLRSNPDMTGEEKKKIKGQLLGQARAEVGAKKKRVEITDREWEAIQAGAISNNKLVQIVSNADIDEVKKLATPRTNNTISTSKRASIKAMLARGYTMSEVADRFGISASTVSKIANE